MRKFRQNSYVMICFAGLLFVACRNSPSRPEQALSGLEIAGASQDTYSGATIQLAAIAIDDNGDRVDVTAEANWSVTPEDLAQVSPTGLFMAFDRATGSVTVQALLRGQAASTEMAILTRATDMAVRPVQGRVGASGAQPLRAVANLQGGAHRTVTDEIMWSVEPSNAGVVDNDGMFRPATGASGPVRVVAEFQDLTREITVEVQPVFENRFPVVEIPEATFVMGNDNGSQNQRPAHPVHLSAFEIGKYEVTNAEFVAFLNAGLASGDLYHERDVVRGNRGEYLAQPYISFFFRRAGEPPEQKQVISFEDEGFAFETGFSDYPAIGVTWYGARAFCEYYGYRLPTEAEWEAASRAGQQFEYGTADGTLSHDLANYSGVGGADIYTWLSPVGTFPANPFGIHDLVGNVWEFVSDFYQFDYYSHAPMNNPTGPAEPVSFFKGTFGVVLRGCAATGRPLPGCESSRRQQAGAFPTILERHAASPSSFRVARSLHR